MKEENATQSSNVSISADEYFSYKAEKIQHATEEKIKSQFRKSQMITLVSISVVLGAFGSYFTSFMLDRLNYVEYISERSKKSDYLIEESLSKLDRASKESMISQEEISILKKEILTLRLEMEKLEAFIKNSRHTHEVKGEATSESSL